MTKLFSNIGQKWLALPATVLLFLFFILPVGLVIQQALFDPSFTTAHFERFFSRGAYLSVYLNTIQVSVIVSIICLLMGYPVAYFIVRQTPAWRPTLLFLILIPLWMSFLVRTYAWMVVLGREGIINSVLIDLGIIDKPLKLLFTTGTVYVAMIQLLLPIMIISCYSAMTEIDQSLMRAARVFGAKASRAFWEVFLPLSLGGALTGTIVVFILSMGFFITPALLGGRKDMMMANFIESQLEQAAWGFAGAIGAILLATTLIVMWLVRMLTARFIYSARSEDL